MATLAELQVQRAAMASALSALDAQIAAALAKPVESIPGTYVGDTKGILVDSAGNRWTISTAGLVTVNDTLDKTTANVVGLLAWGTPGKLTMWQTNKAGGWWYGTPGKWSSQQKDPRAPAVAAAAPTGPAAITVDFSRLTGNSVPAGMFGVAAAWPNDDNFSAMGDEQFLSAMAQIMPRLYRINCNSGGGAGYWSDNIFRNPSAPDFSSMQRFFDNSYRFIAPDAQLVCGIRLNGRSPDDYGKMCSAMVRQFKSARGKTGQLTPLSAIEVGNEDDQLDINQYVALYQAAESAVHAIDPNIALTGTVDSYVHYDRIRALANSANGLFWPNFHAYAYCKGGSDPTPNDDQLMQNGRAANDVKTCASALAGTKNASAPIFMGEGNVECAAQGDGRQQNCIGAVFWANWIMAMVQTGVPMAGAAIWEAGRDGDYGLVQGGNICPNGRLVARGGQVMGGREVAATSSNGALKVMAVMNGGRFGVMVTNRSGGAITTPVALLNLPGGPSRVARHEISPGAMGGVTSNMGVADSVTFPATSVMFLHN